MNRTHVHLLDLSDQILLTILKKLENIDILYSLLGINNERLDNLAQNTIFTNTLNFVLTSSTDHISSTNLQILDRLCKYVLPRIYYNVKCLIVEPLLMKRILLASSHYPNLTELKLINFERRTALHYFTDDFIAQHIFKHQITDFTIINNDKYTREVGLLDYSKNVYGHIFTFLKNLTHLTIIAPPNSRYPPLVLVGLPSTIFSSLILTKLSINVAIFDDCLFLLDGRLKQLSTFIVEVNRFSNVSFIGYNRDNLPNLKCFSLVCRRLVDNYNYDDRVVPLVRRMSQLEKLILYLRIREPSTFIDGSHLHNDILIHLSRLQSFTFYVSTENPTKNIVRQLSNNDVQQTFTYKGYQHASCILSDFNNTRRLCHIFSLPFEFEYLTRIANKFPSIIFNYVTRLEVYDLVPFKHEFFIRIARAFPVLNNLSIMNLVPQNNWCVNNNNHSYTVIEYPHLVSLDITFVHTDYIEQFLMETKTYLPRLNELKVCYAGLEFATENFTLDITRRNCATVKQLTTVDRLVYPQEVYSYFPLL